MRINHLFSLILLFSLSTLFHFPHFYSQIGDLNYDFFLHYNWSKEFTENLSEGDLYPRWIFHGRYGLGEPVFITYSPIHYYFVAAFDMAGLTTWNSMQWVEIITNLFFSWFVFLAARNYVDAKYALLIAIGVLFNPFLVMLHYKFHGFAWASSAYLSHGMLLWALTRKESVENRYFNFWAAIAIGLAVGTHIISALVNLICYSFYCLALFSACNGENRKPIILIFINWGLTVIVGLLLSTAYLLPALYYLDIINSESWNGDYRLESFAWPIFTLLEKEAYWISMQWPVALPGLLMFFIAVAYYTINFRNPSLGKLALPVSGGLFVAAASIFFASELSYIIWTFQNPISQINLPYRFVSVLYTAITFVSGLLLFHSIRNGKKFWAISIVGALGLSIIAATGALYKANYLDGSAIPKEVIQDQYTFQNLKEDFKQPDYFDKCTENKKNCVYSHHTAAGFRGVPEYALKWAGPDYLEFAHKNYQEYCKHSGFICDKPERDGSGLIFRFNTNFQSSVILPIFYYPGWEVSIGGDNIPISIDKSTGLITINLSPGKHVIALNWKATSMEIIGQFTSIFILLALLIHAFWVNLKKYKAGRIL